MFALQSTRGRVCGPYTETEEITLVANSSAVTSAPGHIWAADEIESKAIQSTGNLFSLICSYRSLKLYLEDLTSLRLLCLDRQEKIYMELFFTVRVVDHTP